MLGLITMAQVQYGVLVAFGGLLSSCDTQTSLGEVFFVRTFESNTGVREAGRVTIVTQ